MATLTLVGTVHRDPQGLTKLVKDLARLKPHVITLEFSMYGLTYRRRRKKILTEKLLQGLQEIREPETLKLPQLKGLLRSTGIGGIAALLDLPFEYKGARFYSQRHGLSLHCLDSSFYSRQLLNHVQKLISPENLKKVIDSENTQLAETVIREYKHAENLLHKGTPSPWLQLMHTDEDWQKREHFMADRLRKIVATYQGRHIVHIGGWQHLVTKQGTLYNLLEDLKPQRILLGVSIPDYLKTGQKRPFSPAWHR
jgi:hypothetical protein